MIGTYAQVIALISYGNEYLDTGRMGIEFYPRNSVFRYSRAVLFREITSRRLPWIPGVRTKTLADNPLQWFYQLKQQGCRQIRLAIVAGMETAEEKKRPAYSATSGAWLIETVGGDGQSAYWTSEWRLIRKGSARRWNVCYTKVQERFTPETTGTTIKEATHALSVVLGALISFSSSNSLAYWNATFHHALQALTAEDPCTDYVHKDILVSANYSASAKRLLYAAAKSWVFEGVGSWSDLSFADVRQEARHKSLTQDLYKAISTAFILVINGGTAVETR